MFFGPVMNFYGRKFIPWVIGIVSGSAVAFVCIVLCQFMGLLDYFTTEEGSFPAALISILVSIMIGVVVGFFMKTKLLTIGFCILGGVAGFFMGGIIFNLFMVEWASSLIAFWATLIFAAIIGIGLAYWLKDSMVIMCTSFIGSYIFVRGISMLAGGFPTEMELMNQIETGTAEFTPAFIGYMAAVALFCCVGVWFQYRAKKRDDTEDQYKLL